MNREEVREWVKQDIQIAFVEDLVKLVRFCINCGIPYSPETGELIPLKKVIVSYTYDYCGFVTYQALFKKPFLWKRKLKKLIKEALQMEDVKSVTAKGILSDAKAEIVKEKVEKAKRKLIAKLRELDSAKEVVKNIEREIEDLELEITQEFNGGPTE